MLRDLLSDLTYRLRVMFRRADSERDLADELRFHIDRETEKLVREGLAPDEAARCARVAFGGVERAKEASRDASGVRLVDDLSRDIRYAAGVLRRAPGFTVAVAATIAVGIAATTLVFSVIDALFLRQLPVQDPGRLYVVQELLKNGNVGASDMGQYVYPYEHFLDIADATQGVFSGVAGCVFDVVAVRDGPYAHDMTGIVASSNYFTVLGVRPAIGRFFTTVDERSASTPPEVVIGHEMWEREFNSDSTVIGRTLYADSRPLTIIGVAPPEFVGTTQGIVAELWIPAGVLRQPVPGADSAKTTSNYSVAVFGRLRAGESAAQATARLAVIAPQLPVEHQPGGRQWIASARLDPLSAMPSIARRSFELFMGILMVTALVVLLIAVANVAGMLLARGAYRRREIATRLALGATRARLIRQLVTESVLLCGAGAIAGFVLARWLLSLATAVSIPAPIRIAFDVHLEPIVLIATVLVAAGAGVLTGLMPALESTRMDVLAGLRGTGAMHASRTRDVFITAQLALSLVLLISASLFTRALGRALSVSRGFDARGVMTADVELGESGYDAERAQLFFEQLVERLRARPEVAEASFGKWTPLSLNNNGEMVLLPGEQPPKGRRAPLGYGVVGVGYLEMMHIPLVAGRTFTAGDVDGAPDVIIINEATARRFWPGESPLGRTIRVTGHDREVVGVVRDGKYMSLDEPPQNYAFMPFAQRRLQATSLFVRARGDSADAVGVMRRELNALDPNISLDSPMSVSSKMSVLILPQRIAAVVVGAFGATGLLLAIVGLYGVIAYHVSQRTREFGIRLALGARHSSLVALVLRRGVILIAAAVAIGAVLAIGVTSLAHRFLFGLGALDPLTFATVPLLLAAVAALASYLPARRAARTDPIQSLREE